jgi:pilus assembly protein CpaB
MRFRTLILILLAVILAGGTAFLARNFLARERETIVQEQAPLKVQTPAKSVLVAHTDIKRGQILRPEDTVWQIWPEGGLDRNYIVLGGPPIPARTPESFAGTVARNPIGGGEPITESRIVAPGDRGYLAAVLRPGMRAISVPVTVISGISGFIFPGDQVDLLLTYSVPPQASASEATRSPYDHKAAETVLRNVRVIAIDQRLDSKAGEAVVAHTATFEVTPKESEVIALASEIGKMSLTLRSLVPSPSETPATDEPVVAAANQSSADSPAATATFTLDTEISPLLPRIINRTNNRTDAPEAIMVTILRGGRASESK